VGEKYNINIDGKLYPVRIKQVRFLPDDVKRRNGIITVQWKPGYLGFYKSAEWDAMVNCGDVVIVPKAAKIPVACPAFIGMNYDGHFWITGSFPSGSSIGTCTSTKNGKITITWSDNSISHYGYHQFAKFMKCDYVKEIAESSAIHDGRFSSGSRVYAKYGTNDGSFYFGRIEYIINGVRVHWEDDNSFTDYTITRFNAAVKNKYMLSV
tara:strand:+ start:290 stop:916 length:627 start_codon:yes stop_codon:yes gene_type:complete